MANDDPLASSFGGPLPSPSDSLALFHQAKDGDDEAMNQLLARYQERLRRIVRVRMGPGIGRYLESMDIVQGTYQVAWRKLATIEVQGSGSILAWLSRVAEHQIQDAVSHRKAEKRDWRREVNIDAGGADSDPGIGASLEGGVTLPPEKAARAELPEIIDKALNELPETQREVIVLRDYCGGEWDEIATTLKKSLAAAQELHRRARIKLAVKLGPLLGTQ